MTGSDESGAPDRDVRADAERRRRLAAVFGDVFPETTSDERDAGDQPEAGNDAWLQAQVPPHHG